MEYNVGFKRAERLIITKNHPDKLSYKYIIIL